MSLLRRSKTPSQPSWQELENYKLYDYQQLVTDKFKNTKAVLISDDMGLGKTLEAIDLDWKRRAENGVKGKPTLILTPMSVVPEWERHYESMLPHLRVVSLDPKDRASFLKAVRHRTADIYIMHWDALRLLVDPKKDPNQTMRKTQWFHIIGDEIHRIKNRKAQVTRALKRLPTEYKTGMSGTPADNKPHDLWSILNWLYPQNFRSYWNFYRTYVRYEVDPVHGYHKVTGVRNADHLHKQLKSFYIRRRKEEVKKDLPEKYYNTLWVDLSPTQRKQYNQMKKNMITWVGEHKDKPMAAPAVITQLLRLQQFCVASADVTTVQRKNRKTGELEEIPKYILMDPSTKLDVAMQLLEDTDEPIVFFSQFKSLINLLGQRLEKAGISYGLLTGDTPQADRGTLVRDFQAGKLRVFAGTIAAGGVGITLTNSSHVVFFDRAWSPSWNRQAEDRLHRVGQKNAVQVTDIMARNTIDLGRVQQIQQKWTWIQMILGDKTFDYQKNALRKADELGAEQEDALKVALELAFGKEGGRHRA